MTNRFLESLTGGYTPLKNTRFLVMACALIDSAAHLYAGPSAFPLVSLWIEVEVAAFIVIGIVFLLGLRIWYLPSIVFTVFNLLVYLASGLFSLGPLNPTPLAGHVDFMNYGFGRAFSMGTWIFIILVGTLLIFIDRGSSLNSMLSQDDA